MKLWKAGILLTSVTAVFFLLARNDKQPFLTFDASMSKAGIDMHTLYHSVYGEKWHLVKKLYEKHLKEKPSKEPRIPKIIHKSGLGDHSQKSICLCKRLG